MTEPFHDPADGRSARWNSANSDLKDLVAIHGGEEEPGPTQVLDHLPEFNSFFRGKESPFHQMADDRQCDLMYTSVFDVQYLSQFRQCRA